MKPIEITYTDKSIGHSRWLKPRQNACRAGMHLSARLSVFTNIIVIKVIKL